MVNATYRRRSAGEILRDDLGRDRTRNTKKTAEDSCFSCSSPLFKCCSTCSTLRHIRISPIFIEISWQFMICHVPRSQESHRSPLANLRPHPSWCHRAWPAPRCTPSQVQCGCMWLESSEISKSSAHLFTVWWCCCHLLCFSILSWLWPSQVPWMLNVLAHA